jgi:hypothetical protein
MGLFDRRKRDEPKPEAVETEPDQRDGEDEPLDGPATLYRTTYMTVVPAGDDVLLNDPERDAPVLLPIFELDLLTACTHFASVEEHADAAARRTGLPAEGIAQRLYEMVDRGLLASKQEVMARARAAVEENTDSAPTLDRVAVITGDRPASLAACLRSYRKRYGADIELIVFDDSADPAPRAENRRVAREAAAGGRVLYAGEDEKRKFIAELAARSGVEQDVVRAALIEFDGCTFHSGANRNAVLLDAAGGAVLMVDDDTTARTTCPADASDGLRLSSRYDPWSLHFFKHLEDALDAADWRDTDVLAWHRRFLGRSPAACMFGAAAPAAPLVLNANGAGLDLNEADAALIGAFSRGRGRVVVTSAGLVGDSGMGAPLNFLWLQGSARERLLEDYESYRATRAVHRFAEVATLSSTPFLMTPHVAFDVRATIPPFSPVLRNEDGAFGSMLRTCSPESYIAFLPWSVEHAPPDARAADFDQSLRAVSRVHANSVIRDFAAAHEPAPGVTDPAVRLSAFGRYLTSLGNMQPADFAALVRYQITFAVGRRIEALTRAVDQNSGQPEPWADDCRAVITEGLRSLTEDEPVVADISGTTADERHRRFQRLLYRFGRVIDAWPTLLEAAKDQRVAEALRTAD